LRSVFSHCGRNHFCWHKHQWNINSVTAIDCRTNFDPQSKEEIDKPQVN